MAGPEIRVEGLASLRRDMRAVEDLENLRELREGLKAAADLVARDARSRVPRRTGRAAASVRATAGGNRAYVRGGRKTVPYYGWLDFGSRTPVTGNPRSVGPWAGSGNGPPKGRFIYPALDRNEAQVVEAVADSVSKALRRHEL